MHLNFLDCIACCLEFLLFFDFIMVVTLPTQDGLTLNIFDVCEHLALGDQVALLWSCKSGVFLPVFGWIRQSSMGHRPKLTRVRIFLNWPRSTPMLRCRDQVLPLYLRQFLLSGCQFHRLVAPACAPPHTPVNASVLCLLLQDCCSNLLILLLQMLMLTFIIRVNYA